MSTSRAVGTVPVAFPRVATGVGKDEDQARTRGFTQGHAAGYTAGLRHAAQETGELRRELTTRHAALEEELRSTTTVELAAVVRAASALAQASLPVLADAEQTLMECALALAGAVVHREVYDAGSSARVALARALAGLDANQESGDGPHEGIRVRMNPVDAQALEAAARRTSSTGVLANSKEHDPDVDSLTPVEPVSLAGLVIVPDAALAPGDSVAEYPDGFLDARITSALERARRALLGESI
ncbi:hypothetical protein [Arthrobacter cryoconiti]|uniref:Flagellar assembly protein FliH/Type III secretion system HrpE domain-containing protein n=1 Tax=Arthrobacter cryoconiti TaxID=748907 RepID=A0ABV8QY71_9MICC|nr:hypothetical protein [Arthrobacter cryoconiti]MCC9067340.1 hypothetical protein [Arthrobacter cryoconiti]